MSPSESLSSSTDFLVVQLYGFPAPPIFATGRGGFLQLLSMSLPSCCRSHPARVARRYGQFATIHAAFALRLWARPPDTHFRGHLCVHSRYGPMARHHPKDDAVDRFQKFGSLLPAIQATRLLTLTSVGFIPTEHASLRWTHNRT